MQWPNVSYQPSVAHFSFKEGKVLKFMFLLGKRFIRKIHQRHGEYYFVVNRSRVATSIAKPGKMAEHFPVREF